MNIQTGFPKLPASGSPEQWVRFFHAGTDWLEAYDIIKKEQVTGSTSWLPYVYPYMLGLTIELFVKAIVSHEDNAFNPKSYSHNTTRIINDYADCILILDTISKDAKLIGLIKSFEATIDTKFGDTRVSINEADEKLVSDCAFEIRKEMCKRTGLR